MVTEEKVFSFIEGLAPPIPFTQQFQSTHITQRFLTVFFFFFPLLFSLYGYFGISLQFLLGMGISTPATLASW